MPDAPTVTDADTHDERVTRTVLADMDYIARQVGPTQATPLGKKVLTQPEEDALWDFMDEQAAAQAPEMVAQIEMAAQQMADGGQPPDKVEQFRLSQTLKLALAVFPKRAKLIKTGRPTLTEQAHFAKQMALRADKRQRGEPDDAAMPTEAPPPEPLASREPMDSTDAAPEAPPMSGASLM